ncbi:MAG: hypothetical protein CSA18_02915 [Deltaproteobacteria bacterium]|nr:MAG: hypothetical protein CSA18_02915 [Deltaproteobacteria bacterium]
MNDFLRNLRRQQKDRFPGSYVEASNRSSYPHPDRRSKSSSQKGNADTEILLKKLIEIIPEFKKLMNSVITSNDNFAKLMERFVAVEEKRNIVFESLGKSMEILAERFGLEVDSGENTNDFKKTKKITEEEKDRIMGIIFDMRKNGSTYEDIAVYLDSKKYPTFSNKGRWHAQTIHRLYQKKEEKK